MDPAWITGGLSLLGSLFGGSSARAAQESANRTNIMLNRENRDWMEKMSNTSYQRGMEDMKSAGLNPMLAFNQGGASTPQNSAATVMAEDAMGKAIQGASRDVLPNLIASAQIKNINANTAVATQKAHQEEVIANRMLTETIGGGDLPPSIQDIRWGRERDEARQAKADADSAVIEARVNRALENTKIASGRTAQQIQNHQLGFEEARKLLTQLQIPEARALATWFEAVGAGSPAMKATMSISQWLKFILSGRGK